MLINQCNSFCLKFATKTKKINKIMEGKRDWTGDLMRIEIFNEKSQMNEWINGC